MTTAYRIKDWKRHFEVNQSKSIKGPLSWVSVKTKHDGKGFRRLMAMKDGISLYGAFILIVQVAGKCPVKGLLADFDGALTAEDLQAKTGCPAKTFAKSLQVISSQEIGWIEEVSDYSMLQDSVACYRNLQPSNVTGRDVTRQDETEDCSEPPSGDSEQPPVEVLVYFPVVGSGPTEWPLDRRKLEEFQEAYPGVDVLGESRKARLWCVNNPRRRKTPEGMLRFLTNWLSKAQNSGIKSSPATAPKKQELATDDDKKSYNPNESN